MDYSPGTRERWKIRISNCGKNIKQGLVGVGGGGEIFLICLKKERQPTKSGLWSSSKWLANYFAWFRVLTYMKNLVSVSTGEHILWLTLFSRFDENAEMIPSTVFFQMKEIEMPTSRRTAPSKPHTQPTQRLSGPPPIYKLGAENHMLQLNILVLLMMGVCARNMSS